MLPRLLAQQATCAKLVAVSVQPLLTYRGTYQAPPAGQLVERIEKPPAGVQSLGARMLAGLPPSARSEVEKRTGKSRSIVHRWGKGERYPGEQERATMRDAFGIPVDAWKLYLADQLPKLQPPEEERQEAPPSPRVARSPEAANPPAAAPSGDGLPSPEGTLADRITSMLHYLTRAERTPEQVAQARELRQLLALDAKVKGQLAAKGALEDHPDFPALVETMLDAVEELPGGIDRLLAVLQERKAAVAPAAQKAAA
jgi:hypothetical protein